jgi:phosphatidylglycerophosphate synthase
LTENSINEPDTVGNDCYSDGERAWMESTQQLRAEWLKPLLVLCTQLKITANHTTLFAFVFGLLFLPLWFWINPWAAIAGLAVHVLLDGVDGPIARHQGTASGRGSFIDTVSDQCVVTWVVLTLMLAEHLTIAAGTLHVFFYTLVVAFAMVRNAMSIPFSWLVRPRFFVYGWIILELTIWPGTFEYLVWGFTATLVFKTLTGFNTIRKSL